MYSTYGLLRNIHVWEGCSEDEYPSTYNWIWHYTRFFSLESCCISLSLMAGQWPSAGKDCNGIECFKQMMKAEESQTPTSGNEHVAVALEQVAILETCRRFGEITCVCFVWQSFFPAPTPLNSKAPPVWIGTIVSQPVFSKIYYSCLKMITEH